MPWKCCSVLYPLSTISSQLKSVFFGTPEFAATILRELVERGENIVAVVTTPDKPRGRGLRMESSAVSHVAEALKLPILKPAKHRNPEFLDALRALDADVFVVVAYKILPVEVIELPPKGAFNIHASLLPKFRGAAPINWAIIRGEHETGITTFLLERGVDRGPILLAKRIPISDDETAGELHDRLMALGAECAVETLAGIASGALHPTPQTDEGASDAPRIFPDDCIINFDRPAKAVHNFIRGLSPYPGAVAIYNSMRLKLLRSAIATDVAKLEAGNFSFDHARERIFVGTEDTPVEILELQREGKRALSAAEFVRGLR